MKNAPFLRAIAATTLCSAALHAGVATAAVEDFVNFASGPDLGIAIPDNDATGVSDTITVTADGPIQRLFVLVTMEHTYVGDLTWTLTGPDGTTITLAETPGSDAFPAGSSANLEATPEGTIAFAAASPFDSEWLGTVGGCSDTDDVVGTDCVRFVAPADSYDAFIGTSFAGDWTLTITDTQAFDTGTLEFWEIAAEIPAPPALLLFGSALIGAMGVRRSARAV
jgi:subtilisin-like proprotein convertase family protein